MSETRTGSVRQISELFPESDIPRILEALRRGCAGLKKTSETELENQITTRLYKWLARGQPFRDGPLDIRPQVSVVDLATDDDDVAGQVDLMVTCARGTDVYFAIEAKRLRIHAKDGKVAALADRYVKEGMMRFVTGQYAPKMQSGAMLGYVFDGNVTLARQNVLKAIDASAPTLQLRSGKGLLASGILASASIDETLHDLTGRSFTIYHLLVPV